MQQLELNVNHREVGKQKSKSLRRTGLIPGIYYDKNESIPFVAKAIELRPIIYTAETHLVNLHFQDTKEVKASIMKEVIFDPITDKIVHLDMLGITGDHKLNVEIPVILKGIPIGVREGGILQQNYHKLEVSCFPQDIPHAIEIDVLELGLHKSIYVKDLNIPNIHITLQPDTPIVTIAAPRVIKEDVKEEVKTEA